MFTPGSKLIHVKSPNFIYETADAFNIIVTHTGAGPRMTIVAGRDAVDVTQETFVEIEGGVTTGTVDGDSMLIRYAVANLTVPLDAARELCKVLQKTIADYDLAMERHVQGRAE